MPKDLPPKSTAHFYFMLWDWDGTLDLGGNNCEALAGFAGARRLDRCVQGQKIGLVCDVVDQANNLADLGRCPRQALHHLIGLVGFRYGSSGDLARMADLTADLGDRGGQFLRGRASGWADVQRAIRSIDAVQAAKIDAADGAPDYWLHFGNRLAAAEHPRPYTQARHLAWLLRRRFSQ